MGSVPPVSQRNHELRAMKRALILAVSPDVPRGPNPRVGCVLLAPDGEIVGEGHHRGAGTEHAEVDALAKAGDAARGATAVVTLEPCDHSGRTGPCTQALIGAGVARVVYAQTDPNPVAAGGAAVLRAAGLDVEGGLFAAQAMALNETWTFAVAEGRPFVTWKSAATLDGRVAAADGTSRWITSAAARAEVHDLRAEVDAVMVGTGTVVADDPQLTVRDEEGAMADVPQPLRVVVGMRDLPAGARVLDGSTPSLQLRTRDPQEVLRSLHEREVRHVLLEGGPRLAAAFVRAGLVDRVVAYVAPALLGSGPSALGDAGMSGIGDALRLRVGRRAPRRLGRAHRRAGPTPAGGADVHRDRGGARRVVAVDRIADGAARLTVRGPLVTSDATHGASIAVNGVCLTVVEHRRRAVHRRRHAGDAGPVRPRVAGGRVSPVNLERPLTLSARLGGHLVQGHVDGVGRVLQRTPAEHWDVVRVELPAGLARYVVDKGSITVDGVSLTVVEAGPDWFTVRLIPTTLELTTLGHKRDRRRGQPRGRRRRQVRRADAAVEGRVSDVTGTATEVRLDPVEHAIDAIRAGRAVVVVDDEDRENEGDLIFAAQRASRRARRAS